MSRAPLGRSALAALPIALLLACSAGDVNKVPPPNAGDSGTSTSPYNSPQFDPATGVVPLPNVLATAAKAAFNLTTEAPTAAAPLNPLNSLRYVNTLEMAGTHAVAGINAPILMEFGKEVDASSLATGLKVFEITGAEKDPLGFTDVSALFNFQRLGTDTLTEGTYQVLGFPRLPLKPGTRYVYMATRAVKDAASGLGVSRNLMFSLASQSAPLVDANGNSTSGLLNNTQAAALEGIRGDKKDGTGTIVFSGYAKTLDNLVAAGKIATREDVTVLGRFNTTAAMATYTDPTNPASLKPIDALLKAFATAGASGNPFTSAAKLWDNTVTVTTVLPASAFFTGSFANVPHDKIKNVVLGSFTSTDLAVDPKQAMVVGDLSGVDATTMNSSGTNSTYKVAPTSGVAYGVLAQRRHPSTQALLGFYNVPRTVNFIYFEPASPASSTVPTVLFEHGIGLQKEFAAFVANTPCGLGQGVLAIDQALHGGLARPGLTGNATDTLPNGARKGEAWANDYMSLASPLTGRTNIQQSAFHLFRLEYLVRTGAMASALGASGVAAPKFGATGNITFAGQSLGSISGAYFLAGTTSINPSTGVYDKASIEGSMKGFLSVPGSKLAYLLNASSTYGPAVKAGLSAGIKAQLTSEGLVEGTPAFTAAFKRTYQSVLTMIQSSVDPADPATMGHPALSGLTGADALSRFSGRLLVQEAKDDDHIPNFATRYFATSFAGWNTVSPVDFAPGFKQITYATGGRIVAPFMTKSGAPAAGPTATTPVEGYFQFDQAGITHGFLWDFAVPGNTALGQKQLAYFLGAGGASIVVDPTATGF